MIKKKILIIEDESIIAMNIRRLLEKKGYIVCDIGASAKDAVDFTGKHTPDLILMDIILNGEKDGIYAVERINEKHDIPIIYLTAHTDEMTINRAKATEPSGFITKPINIDELNSVIEIALYKHKMEMKLKESEKKYRELFNTMLNGFAYCKMIFDENNKPINWIYFNINDAFERITGLKRENTIGKQVTEIIPGIKEDTPELFDIYGKVAQTGENISFEIYLNILKLWLSVNVYCPEKGYFVAIFEDISKRKKTEETLVKSEEFFRRIAEMSTVVIYVTDANGKCIYANPLWQEHTGQTFEEALGDGRLKGLHPDDREMVANNWKKMVESNGKWGLEYRCQNKEGKTVWVYGTANPLIGENGEITGYVGVNMDITEYKKGI